MPHNAHPNSTNRQNYKRDPNSMDIQKPFQQHNANKKAEVQYIHTTATPISNKKIQHSYDSSFKNEFNSKDTENHSSTYHSKQEGANIEVELTKHNLHSYKSHTNLTRFKVRKSPSHEYLKIKKKMEKDMITPTEKLFRDQHIRNGKKTIKSTNKVSPDGGLRQLRSASPKYNNAVNHGTNPMDSYRKKKAEDNKKKQKLSSERYNSSNEIQNHTKNSDFSNEKVKKNYPKPSVNRSKYQILKNMKPATDNQDHTDKDPEDSLQKLNQKARYKSPKWKVLTTGKKLPYEQALAFTEKKADKIHRYYSPHAASRYSKNLSKIRARKNNDKLGHSPTSDSVFQRLYQEKDLKRIKQEAMNEEHNINREKVLETSVNKSHSKSGKRSRHNSKSPDDTFYKKQVELQIDSDRKLIVAMYEKAKKFETDIKSTRQTSRSRRRHDVIQPKSTNQKVHERLFHDVKARSRKRLGIEHESNHRNYDSVGNLSVSSLTRSEYRKGAAKKNTSESLYIPVISKNSRKMATPKRNKNISINSVLYKDAQIRREKHEADKKRSKSRDKENLKKTKKGTLKTSRKMLIKRYLIEFDDIAHKLGVGEEPEESIHYTQYSMLMQLLGFIGDNAEVDNEKLKMIWGVIQDQYDDIDSGLYCRKHSLKVICAAICGFSSKWMFKEYTKGQNVETKAPKRSVIDLFAAEATPVKLDIGCFIEGLLFLNHQEEADYINRLFIPLYNNRLIQKDKQKSLKRQGEIEIAHSKLYKPQINKTAESLNISLKNQGPVEQRLLSKQKEYDQKLQYQTAKKNEESYSECTFAPRLEKNYKANYTSVISTTTKRKVIQKAYDKFISSETSQKLKDEMENIASKINKQGEVVNIRTPRNILQLKDSDKQPDYRYQETPERDMEELKQEALDNSQEFDSQEDQVMQGEEDFANYLQNTDYRPSNESIVKIENNYPKEPNIEPIESIDVEQSGSDHNEEEHSSPLKANNTSEKEEPENRSEDDRESSHHRESIRESSAEGEGESEEENFPILFLDVNLGKDRVERLVIYDGDDPFAVADEFCAKHCLEDKKKKKLAKVIKKQLDSLLTRIDEDEDEESSRDQ
jgi:hypothetical protein